MKKIIRLTESDLTRIVKRVIMEQDTVIPTPSESAQKVPDKDPSYSKVEKINLPNGVYKGMNGNLYFYVCDSNGSFTGYVVEGNYFSRGETPVDNQNIGIYNGENLSNITGEKGGWYKDVGYIVSK